MEKPGKLLEFFLLLCGHPEKILCLILLYCTILCHFKPFVNLKQETLAVLIESILVVSAAAAARHFIM